MLSRPTRRAGRHAGAGEDLGDAVMHTLTQTWVGGSKECAAEGKFFVSFTGLCPQQRNAPVAIVGGLALSAINQLIRF